MLTANKYLFLNQMAGPLFRELAEDLSQDLPQQSELYTGHPDTLSHHNSQVKLHISAAPVYNRKNKFTRLFSWITYSMLAFGKILWVEQGTVIFVVSNPPVLGPLVTLACKIRRLPYLVLVYDMHPDTLISFGVLTENSLLTKCWRGLNQLVWEHAAAVYTIGQVMAERLATQFKVHKTRLGEIGVIPPWADTDVIKPLDKNKNPLTSTWQQERCLTVLYSGNMGISHDIDSMLQAALLLKNNDKINFLFIGEGQKWQYAKDFVMQHQLTTVQVLPFQPENQLPYTMALGDVSLVALDKGAEGLMVPSKMYYYMAAGSAIIGICQGRNDLEQSLKLGNCGLVVAPGRPEELAQVLIELSTDPLRLATLRANARTASVEHFSRTSCINNMKNSLRKWLKPSE